MVRRSLKLLLVALVATFALASSVDAAPRKAVRHRARHSTRVSSSTSTPATHKTTGKSRKHTTKSTHAPAKPHQPSTKPR